MLKTQRVNDDDRSQIDSASDGVNTASLRRALLFLDVDKEWGGGGGGGRESENYLYAHIR